MNEFWIFSCPPGGDPTEAERGDILCPMQQVWAETNEVVLEAFPTAVRVYRISGNGMSRIA